PKYFKKLSKGRVPVNSLLFSMGCIVIGTSMLFIIPNVMTAFTIFSSLTTVLILFVYGMMLISYLAYRKKAPELHKSSVYKMPMGVVMSWVCLAFLVFVAVVLSLDHDTRIAIYFSPIWFGGLYIAYRYRAKRNAERSWILQHGKRIERE
ncbi:amino acid permease, partial [Acinetobacter sp. FNA3]